MNILTLFMKLREILKLKSRLWKIRTQKIACENGEDPGNYQALSKEEKEIENELKKKQVTKHWRVLVIFVKTMTKEYPFFFGKITIVF